MSTSFWRARYGMERPVEWLPSSVAITTDEVYELLELVGFISAYGHRRGLRNTAAVLAGTTLRSDRSWYTFGCFDTSVLQRLAASLMAYQGSPLATRCHHLGSNLHVADKGISIEGVFCVEMSTNVNSPVLCISLTPL